MKTKSFIIATTLILGGAFILTEVQAQQGIKRHPDAVRHDLHHGQEVVQVRVDFEPGVGFPAHSHPGVEVAYVLEGTIEYELEGRTVTLKAGEALYIPAGVVHAAKNPGKLLGAELATYIVEKGKPIVVLVK